MTLLDKIPTMSDDEVINLLANAKRLEANGDEKQKAAAAELLPALETAAAERKTAKLEAAQVKRAATRKPKAADAAAA